MAVIEAYKGVYYFWKFLPSRAASITGLVVFLIMTIVHTWRICKFHSWFCIWFTIGCFCEVIGFGARYAAYSNTASIGIYIIQISFLIIPPVFFAASVYMTLSRIIRSTNAGHLSPIRLSRLTKTFVWGDLISLGIQGGASNLTTKPETAKIGQYLVLAGLFFQLLLLGFFFAAAAVFQIRLRKNPTREAETTKTPWRKTLQMIYVVSALIFARSVFRVVEYVQGPEGYCFTNEWTLYVFDTAPMFIVTVAFWWWYPGYVKTGAEEGEIESMELNGGRE